MNTHEIVPPTSPSTASATRPEQIRLMIEIPDWLSPLAWRFPLRNWEGTDLLVAALNAQLSAVRLLVATGRAAGELNHSNYHFVVTDRGRAFGVIRALLEELHLLEHSAAAYFNPEEIWTASWPEEFPHTAFVARFSEEWGEQTKRRGLHHEADAKASLQRIVADLVTKMATVTAENIVELIAENKERLRQLKPFQQAKPGIGDPPKP